MDLGLAVNVFAARLNQKVSILGLVEIFGFKLKVFQIMTKRLSDVSF